MSLDELLASADAQTLDLLGKNKDGVVEDFTGHEDLERYSAAVLWGARLGAFAAIKTLHDAGLLSLS